LALAAAVESRSEHPLARAVVEAARERSLPIPEARGFKAHTGLGAEAMVDGKSVAAGSPRFLQGLGVDLAEFRRDSAEAGGTLIPIAVEGKYAGYLVAEDPLKPHAAEALAALMALGIEPALLTGDRLEPARAVAAGLGISEVRAGLLPEDKAEALRAWRKAGRKAAFAGDGINDAPALAAAHAGLAMGGGSDIAVEAGDIILLAGDVRGLPRALALARRTLRIIRLNLFWAFGYNAVLIPVAAGALAPWLGWSLNPVLAGAAMGLSSVFVLTNSLRLRKFRPPV
jgi:Cu+-exporting ATPase